VICYKRNATKYSTKFCKETNIQERNYHKCLQDNTIVHRTREFRYEQRGNWIDFYDDFTWVFILQRIGESRNEKDAAKDGE